MKSFILDTNVLLHDARAFYTFGNNEVVLPIYVIEEIDNFKKDIGALGRNARYVARLLDSLREEGDLGTGVPLPSGGTLRIAWSNRGLPPEYVTERKADNSIMATAMQVLETNRETGRETIFVTKDVNLRVRAHAMGLTVADFDLERQDISELYSGVTEVQVSGAEVDTFYQEGSLPLPEKQEVFPNQYTLVRAQDNTSHTALGRINTAEGRIEQLHKLKSSIWGIRPRNKEQNFAFDLLMDDRIPLVTLVGKAGTGKTLIAVAAGLQMVAEESRYSRLLISRPVIPMGKDIGYLPGDMEDKLGPWMQPIYDNVEFLASTGHGEDEKDSRGGGGGRRSSYIDYLFDEGILEIEPLTYIRGRSIPNQFMIVDEAQNLTPHEIKTILTRVGENTKIVFTGDPYQIDNPYVDTINNGLVHLVRRFAPESLAGHVTLLKGERSDLAELAATLL